jgi:hypothetical protein
LPTPAGSAIRALAVALAAALVAGCGEPAAPPANPATSAKAPAGFVNRVWTVRESPGVAAGTLYVFLSEGTLVVTSPNSRPALGKWTFDRKILTMVEEGISYRVDILALTAEEFKILSHNPGGALEITMVPAPVPEPRNAP